MEDNKNKPHIIKALPIVVFVIVVALWGMNLYFLYNKQDRGTFGDMFGAVNALFSGLAFAGVIYAILLQREELKLQRRELELTRKELEGQKQQLQAQNETLKLQKFENTFFQMLKLHNDIVSEMRVGVPNGGVEKGRLCFGILYNDFRRTYKDHFAASALPEREKTNSAYLAFYRPRQDEIGHYFRTLYNIFKFVKSSGMENKKYYTNLVRAQLSTFELALLFYNCISVMGQDKFKPLVIEFNLVKHLPTEFYLDPIHARLI